MTEAKSKTRSPETVAAVSRLMASILASPRLKRFEQHWAQALKGDREALVEVVDDSGIEVFDDEDLKRQIYLLDPRRPAERRVLERIVQKVRKHLLKTRGRGRPARTSDEVLGLSEAAQRAFESCPVRLKARYDGSRVKQLDIKRISEHVARSVPLARRESIYVAAQMVLNRTPGIGKVFGDEVAAEACSCSSRQIRSLRNKRRTRK